MRLGLVCLMRCHREPRETLVSTLAGRLFAKRGFDSHRWWRGVPSRPG